MTDKTAEDCQLLVTRALAKRPYSAAVVWSVPEGGATSGAELASALANVSFSSDLTWPECVRQVAFSASALDRLGIDSDSIARCGRSFTKGMTTPRLQRALGDLRENAPKNWSWSDRDGSILWLLYATDEATLEREHEALASSCREAGLSSAPPLLTSLPEDSREPFGFVDGITNVAPRVPSKAVVPESLDLVAPGEVILGRRDALGITSEFGWLGNGGSFLVIRQLEQDVQSFWSYWLDQASKDVRKQVWLAAKAMGRWPNGVPTRESEPTNEPDIAKREVEDSIKDEFDFVADRYGAGCPLGAHIRRARPRMGLDPEDPEFSRFSDATHRLVRRGRKYGPPAPKSWFPPSLHGTSVAADDDSGDDETRGLLFVALMGDFSRQFEFVQQTWLNNPRFVTGAIGSDPVAGGRGIKSDERAFAVQDERARTRYFGLPVWITVKAGGYFLLPSRPALERISSQLCG